MKNLIFAIIGIACIGLIVFGVLNKNQSKSEVKNQPTQTELDKTNENNNPAQTSVSGSTTQPGTPVSPVTQQTPIKQEMKKYYPSNTPISGGAGSSGSAGAPVNPDQGFQITSRLLAQMHLVDKYKPGICFGAPSAPPQAAIDGMIASNTQLAQFLKQQYKLATDLDVYNKIKQLQGIFLTEIQSGKFDFRFMDGQCSNVIYYEGTVTVVGSQVTDNVTSQEAHSYE